VVLCAAPASASYRQMALTDLLRQADVIVDGTITNIDERTFTLETKSVIAGLVSTKSLRVSKFFDWTCARRWAPYAAGQRVLLFLEKNEVGNWRVLGAGNEGEFPIAEGCVFSIFPHFSSSDQEPHIVYGKPFTGFAADAAALTRGLRSLRACMKPQTDRCTPEVRAAIERDDATAVLDLRLNWGF
jgi:hypothetical protein